MNSKIATDDVHVRALKTLISPAVLIEEFPVSDTAAELIDRTRKGIENVLSGADDRLVVVVGPCSVHDTEAAIEYGQRLRTEIDKHHQDLLIVMRVYFEKPRTTVGWKGLINDPNIDGSFDINLGLRKARGLLQQLAELGVPAGTEFLDTISPQFMADYISWGAIGARTTESQLHRELASGLSMPVGFKNGTAGSISIAVDAIVSASDPHHFLSVTKQGISAIVTTEGNRYCHLILRGSRAGHNYDAKSIQEACDKLAEQSKMTRVMIDCSHGNSDKDYRKQPAVVATVAEQIANGNTSIAGVMIESNLHEGSQKTPEQYGVSITDACISWETTEGLLDELAAAVRQRRETRPD